ncbi:Prophenol oxidase activating enzyme 3 [Operophtera brumata]|uniref:Prophenol oxidase activating enzyme 3 n=1 Tax=Operophtera brumata TaxID=104452 RepID=A0A0L7L0F2_OPEBR|nr:Prophenol oxidase activating enzyme 3 [Operophtera brumata]
MVMYESLYSRCTSSDPQSVCCGPPRKLVNNTNLKCRGLLTASPPDPNSQCCGRDARVGNKITGAGFTFNAEDLMFKPFDVLGGNETTVDQYPWLALIEYTKDNGPIRTMCGGALISGRYVLTAAHCVTGQILSYGSPRNVRLGEYDTSHVGKDCAVVEAGGEDCNDGIVTIGIEESIPHSDYNKNGQNSKNRNDIALIRLAQSAPFTDFIRPICLPSVDTARNPPNPFTLFAAGWGAVSETQPSSAIKLHVDLPYVSPDTCQNAYRAPGRNVALWKGQMCAGGQPGKDSCKGDSGGPLMYENTDKRIYEVMGVVSFGPSPCGLPDIPGVYTKVYEYDTWIRSQIKV